MSMDATGDQTNTYGDPTAKGPIRPRSRMLPFWGWVLLAGYAATVAYIRNIDGLDEAWANIGTLIGTFLTCCALFVWFCFYSGFAPATRRTALIGIPSIIVLLLALFRIDGVWSGLIPQLSWRWTPKPDQLLALPKPASDESIDASVATTSRDAGESNPGAAPGGQMPELRFESQASEDKSLALANSAATRPKHARVDLNTTTPEDFPQFLGPRRSGWIPGPALDTDWSRREPKLLWRQPIGAGWSAFSVVNGFAVTLEQRGEEELTTCYEALTGKIMWSHAEHTRHETVLGGVGPRSTPTISEGQVYALGATGILNCLDGATGSVLWTHHLLDEYHLTPEVDMQSVAWGRAASPLLVDGLVVVPAGGPPGERHVSLVAFDKVTGAKVWEAGEDQIAFASPAVGTLSGVRQILSVNEKTVSGHESETGNVLWTFPWPGTSNQDANNSQAIAVGENRVFVSKGYSGGSALVQVDCDEAGHWTTETIWSDKRTMKTKFTNVVIRDGFVYGLSDGVLECVNLADGKRQWKHGHYGHGQILGVGELLIVQAEVGDVYLVAIDPKSHRQLSHLAALDAKTWNNPTLYGRYLLVRNGEQAACYELPLRESNAAESNAAEPAVSQR